MIKGIGTDIIEIERIEKAIATTPHFLNRVFTEKERAYFEKKGERFETLAGLFAAKEAVSKALGTGFRGFGPSDIEIVPDDLGCPKVKLLEGAQKAKEEAGVSVLQVSISHCQTYAIAYAIAE